MDNDYVKSVLAKYEDTWKSMERFSPHVVEKMMDIMIYGYCGVDKDGNYVSPKNLQLMLNEDGRIVGARNTAAHHPTTQKQKQKKSKFQKKRESRKRHNKYRR